ncbi:MAG TPA: hypothetical protein VFT72_06465 [Opitutaceae bacterium]|nr:hypothetical protein [Opitutaceae bacterium]
MKTFSNVWRTRVIGFVAAWFAMTAAAPSILAAIDREALVSRHNVHVNRIDPESPLSVGNGDFAFTVDVTGLQSFETRYHEEGIPLETLSTWAWHTFPNTENVKIEDAMMPFDFHGRTIHYAGRQNSPAGKYFRENPHPIPLGQVSFVYEDRPLAAEDITQIDQVLDLWTGVVRSHFVLDGKPVTVETTAHADRSVVAVQIDSPLLESGKLGVRLRFPYSHQSGTRNKPPLVWDQPQRHRTSIVRNDETFRQLERVLDASRYFVNVRTDRATQFAEAAAHDFRLSAKGGTTLALTVAFTPESGDADAATPTFAQTRASSAEGWKNYWQKGAALDLSGSKDPRAAELERRAVLSQYLMRVNYAGSFPPSEDGLTNITWFGKHNTEMYFWHAAHFYAWGHPELLEKGLAWYQKILPLAKADAASQGFEGARWPKMAGIDGRPSPGTINPFIIWNQPNPIALCELVYRAHPDRATLEKYRDIVFESAKWLASFAYFDQATQRYVLGPPIKNVSEKAGANTTQNPTFELAYWYYGLQVAQEWRARLGLAPEPRWTDIMQKLSKLPQKNGLYLEIETQPNLYAKKGNVPTSMLMILGFMPKVDVVDTDTVRRTFDEVNRRNGIDHWVSWATGQAAMTATRLGEPELAVRILTNQAPAARFMNNGHVRRPKEPDGCPAYLPVNASVLAALGLMAGGWDGGPEGNAPGFPRDGNWHVQAEGFNRMP